MPTLGATCAAVEQSTAKIAATTSMSVEMFSTQYDYRIPCNIAFLMSGRNAKIQNPLFACLALAENVRRLKGRCSLPRIRCIGLLAIPSRRRARCDQDA